MFLSVNPMLSILNPSPFILAFITKRKFYAMCTIQCPSYVTPSLKLRPCKLFELESILADLSPQDSTFLSDVVEVGPLPCLSREDDETRYCFYILTRHGLRYECSSPSKIQVTK